MERKIVFLLVGLVLIKLGTSQTICTLGSLFRFDLTNGVCNICDCTGQNIPCGSPLDSTVAGVIPIQCTSVSACPNGFRFKDNPTCNCDGFECAPRATPSPVVNGKTASPTTSPVVRCGGNQMYFDNSTGTCQGCACGVFAGSCVDITDNIGSNMLFTQLIIGQCPNVASCTNGFIVTDPDKCGCDGIGCKADPNTGTTTSAPNNCGPNDILAFDETPGYCQACDCTGRTNQCVPVSNSIASTQLGASILSQCPGLTSCLNGWAVLFPNKCSCDGLGCNAPEPTLSPTAADEPTASPTMYIEPTVSPTATNAPTKSPTETPTISPTPGAACAPGDLFEFIDERPNGVCKVCGCGAIAAFCENALLLPSDPQFSQFAKQQCSNIANCPGDVEIVDDTTCSCNALGCQALDPTTSPAMEPTSSPVPEPTSSPVPEPTLSPTSSPVPEPTASPTDATNPCINSPPKFEETNSGKCKICLCDQTTGDYDCTNPLSSNSAISKKEFMDFCSISGDPDTCQLTREDNSCDCDDFKCETRICQDEVRETKSGKKFDCKCQPNGNKICRPRDVTPSPTLSPTIDGPSEKEAIVLLFNAVFEYNMFDFELQARIFQLAATAITTSRILAGLAGINLKFAIPEFEYVCKTDPTFRQFITYGNVTSFDICDLGSILCLDGYIEVEGRVAIIFDSDDYSSKDIIETAFDAAEFIYNEFSDDIGTYCNQISQCGCGDFYLNSAAILVTEDNCVLTFNSTGLDQTPSNTCPYDVLNNVSKAAHSFNINYTFISIFISLMIIVQIY